MTGVVKLLPFATAAESLFIQTTEFKGEVGVALKVTEAGPQEVCGAIVNVSFTGHVEGQEAKKLPNTVPALKLDPDDLVTKTVPFKSVNVKPTSVGYEPGASPITRAESPEHRFT